MKRFSEFARAEPMDGEKIKIQQVIGKEIKILDYKIEESKFPREGNSKRLTLQIETDGIHRVIFTGSSTLMSQVERYKEELPFISTIQLAGRQFTFT